MLFAQDSSSEDNIFFKDFLQKCKNEGGTVVDEDCGLKKFRFQFGPDDKTKSPDICGCSLPASDLKDYDILSIAPEYKNARYEKNKNGEEIIVWGDPTYTKPDIFLKQNVTQKNCTSEINENCAKSGIISIRPKHGRVYGKFKAKLAYYWRSEGEKIVRTKHSEAICGAYSECDEK